MCASLNARMTSLTRLRREETMHIQIALEDVNDE